MSLKKNEIESLIEHTMDDIIAQVFENEFANLEDLEYAVDFLKEKINDLEAEDFEDSIIEQSYLRPAKYWEVLGALLAAGAGVFSPPSGGTAPGKAEGVSPTASGAVSPGTSSSL